MRLIHCRDRRLVDFTEDDIPPYAILSHTWGKEEVTYKDFDTPAASFMAGWDKIVRTCTEAVSDSLQYAWIDTCCIDKSSSAELSEAINSMFQWYARSEICYAFLEDCDGKLDKKKLARSRWMSRGWTLQELIAPQTLVFFDRHWQRTSYRRELGEELNQTTTISKEILERDGAKIDDLLQLVPVCQKMSWACHRKTTRVEDMAYCLMGLFGVNMPLLYGEGSKAFTRLQEEIIRHSNDLTIFAWRADKPKSVTFATDAPEGQAEKSRNAGTEVIRGLLAESPREFSDAQFIGTSTTAYNKEYTITNKGIRISSINVRPVDDSSDLVMDLHCFSTREGSLPGMRCVIIRHIGGGLFVRVEPEVLYSRSNSKYKEAFTADIYLARTVTPSTMALLETVRHDAIRIPKTAGRSFHRQHVAPRLQLQGDSDLFITHGFPNAVGCTTYRHKPPGNEGEEEEQQDRCDLVVFFGLLEGRTSRDPWCFITTPDYYPNWRHAWWAAEENFKHYSIRAQNRYRPDCDVTIKGSAGRLSFYVRGTFTFVDPEWNLNLEIVEKEGQRPRHAQRDSGQISTLSDEDIPRTSRTMLDIPAWHDDNQLYYTSQESCPGSVDQDD